MTTMAALDNPFYFSVKEQSEKKRQGIVFENEETVKYYNVKTSPAAPSQVIRRPSSSLSLKRSSICSKCHSRDLSEPSDVTPSVYRGSLMNKINSAIYSSQTLKSEDMYDIAIFSCKQSEAAGLWVNYLTSCFLRISKEEGRPPFKTANVNIEEILAGRMVAGTEGSRLQIVIMCPTMMQVLETSPGACFLAPMLQPSTVIAMLLGVPSNSLDSHPLTGMFFFEQWRRLTVKDQDPTFVGDFMGVSMDILSRSWQLEKAITQVNGELNQAQFSVIPKKIKVGQNKLIVLLTTPVSATEKINIFVDKNGQKIEIVSFKRRNPYTLQFSVPASCLQTSMLVGIFIEKNGRPLGHRLVKCESRLRELDQLLKSVDNPLHFMCQALGFTLSDKEKLDSFLAGSLQRNIPPNFHLFNSPISAPTANHEEYPTLLHFGARFGLEKLCWTLLDIPGGEQACQMKNANHQTPSEIAESSGHIRLANALKGYMQMTELSSMYHYVKGMSDKPVESSDGNYLLPRPLSDTYLIPPTARPVLPPLPLNNNNNDPEFNYKVPNSPATPLDHYQSPPHARPFSPVTPSTPGSPLDHEFSSYLQMSSPLSESHGYRMDLDFSQARYQNVDALSHTSEHYCRHNTMNSCSSSVSGKMSPQDELVEIINDFKNNVFTIAEVEKLVESWRNRNDVQQSFREKQEQLNYMRREYERIQQTMKDDMKRATPFDKIKKFFSRKSKNASSPKAKGTSESMAQRPVSSLSLHSSCSSSSGQMSTGSGASIGDSGTHSDHDEKKAEEFMFHEKLQSVKECDHGEVMKEEYLAPSPFVGDLPQPPGPHRCTVAMVHKEPEIVPECAEETEELKGETTSEEEPEVQETVPETPAIDTEEPSEMKILEESERLLKNMVDTLRRPSRDGYEKPTVLKEEEEPTEPLIDYVNVSPFEAPPVPPRNARYKNVLL